ncbi:peptide chain release factor N(5)-glutamine methyltransferase [Roseateles sp. SL47]|uniref:peptide chain release factor N(5)-glutamine methyltransferase n=1 Tax=Roseateles sp. SL47 TaxID=2995138 RepID=UPI002271B8CE|nr:peptide chain release factor N(5)-glutamine methyltransferase [Roseateles sp. SL47]WAC73142.1 peptide chain release factor N(5)-glutamine methyltransferase [Roseateles sp. SL47]
MTPLKAPVTVAEALRHAASAGLPRAEAQYLLQAVLDCTRSWLIAHDTDLLSDTQQQRFQDWLSQRLDDVPLAYLVGEKEFFGLRLQVTPDTLVPRPDTEVLVQWALEQLQGLTAPRVVDLGTGSGAIALALASQRPDANVHMVDVSPGALAVASGNAQRLGLTVHAHLGSWFQPLEGQAPFDLIVSNPPYVAGNDHHLRALRHEPRSALTPGGNGLSDIAHLTKQAPAWLKPGAWLLMEHGWDQAESVASLLHEQGFRDVSLRRDLGDQPRASGGRWAG